MSEEIKMVALRIRGLRELSDLSTQEVARVVNVPVEVYEGYESGAADIPVSILYQLASLYHVELTVLLTGEDPHMNDFFVVRSGKGVSVDRRKDYGYQNLAYGFTNKIMEPFLVTVSPNDQPANQYSHPGQEFVHLTQGRMQIVIDQHSVILNVGDSMYYNSSRPHGMKALDNAPAKFLCVISQGTPAGHQI